MIVADCPDRLYGSDITSFRSSFERNGELLTAVSKVAFTIGPRAEMITPVAQPAKPTIGPRTSPIGPITAPKLDSDAAIAPPSKIRPPRIRPTALQVWPNAFTSFATLYPS